MNRLSLILRTLALLTCLLPAAAGAVVYTYDEAGRLVRADYGNGQVISYGFDEADNLAATRSENGANTLSVAVSPAQGGTVTGNGIACPTDCAEPFAATPTVALTAAPQSGFVLAGWGGDGTGTANPIAIAMTGDRGLVAYFAESDGNSDGDNLLDSAEMGPTGMEPGYDGNGDGLPDYQQTGTASFAALAGDYVTLAVDHGLALEAVQPMDNPSPADAPASTEFPAGFFSFTVSGLAAGGCTEAELVLPRNTTISGYYVYGPEPANPAPHWYKFSWNGTTGARVLQRGDTTWITLTLCDGLRGDDLPGADGLVMHLGGPAAVTSSQPGADIDVPSRTLAFGPVAAGSSRQLDLIVANAGTGDLLIDTVPPALASPFALAADTCTGATLAPHQLCTFTVSFTPAAQGVFKGSFDIKSNDTGETPLRIYMSGSQPAAAPASPGRLHFASAIFVGDENGGSVVTIVNRSGGASGAVTVDYSTGNGTALAGSDYTATSGTLSWADGDDAPKTFTVPLINDTLPEGFETINLALTGTTGGATLGGPAQAEIFIIESDAVEPDWAAFREVLVALQVVCGLQPQDPVSMTNDFNGNGRIDMADVVRLLQKAAGLVK
ncbi:MAG: choice-of-anchor D domain-containing protein [Thermodesulfobacteriota bacterium]